MLIPSFLALPLFAQAPEAAVTHPVRILLQAENPPAGTPALDTAAIAEKLKSFAKDENLVPPPQDGDGWVLGIGLTILEESNGLLVGGGSIRLSHLREGKTAPNGNAEKGVIVVAWKSSDLALGLGEELTYRCREMLSKAKVIEERPHTRQPVASSQNAQTGQGSLDHPHHFDFSQVKVLEQPRQPPYPKYARDNYIQGNVVVQVRVGLDGVPVSVAAIDGPGPLLPYACGYALRWRFKPLTVDGHPEYGQFRINMYFRLQ